MKVRIVGIPGICEAALVRSGNCNDMVLRALVPAAFGAVDEVFVGKEAFRQRVAVAWATDAEKAELKRVGFVD